MADGLRGDVSEADVAAVVRNNPGAVVDAIRNQAIEPSEVESDSSSTGESDVEELSVGDGTGPPFPDYTNVLEGSESTTSERYILAGHQTGYYPPLDELHQGTMDVYVRAIVQLKSGDSSESAEITMQYTNDTDGDSFFGFGVYGTSSTTYTTVDTDWQLLDGITTTTEPLSFKLGFYTTNSSFAASARDGMVMVGLGP